MFPKELNYPNTLVVVSEFVNDGKLIITIEDNFRHRNIIEQPRDRMIRKNTRTKGNEKIIFMIFAYVPVTICG